MRLGGASAAHGATLVRRLRPGSVVILAPSGAMRCGLRDFALRTCLSVIDGRSVDKRVAVIAVARYIVGT